MIFGCLRVKNESRWIARALGSILPVCNRVLVLDDHSDDDTAEICEALGATVYRSPMNGLNEARDKDWLLSKVWRDGGAKPGDWVLWIDGDEALLDPAAVLEMTADDTANAWALRVLYLWDAKDQVRVDSVYGKFWRPSLFRLTSLSLRFKRTGAAANFHCSNVPHELIPGCRQSEARIAHYGYIDRSDRLRKYEWYRKIDGQNRAEDGYRHMVIGDVFPQSSVFRHGGPLRLVPIEETAGLIQALPKAA